MSFPSYLEEACVELHACNESCSLSQPGPSSHSLCGTGIVRFRHGCLKKVVQDCPSGARTCPGIQAVTSPSRSPGQARVLTGTQRLVHISRLASMGAKVLLGSISIRLPCLQSPGTRNDPSTHSSSPLLCYYYISFGLRLLLLFALLVATVLSVGLVSLLLSPTLVRSFPRDHINPEENQKNEARRSRKSR